MKSLSLPEKWRKKLPGAGGVALVLLVGLVLLFWPTSSRTAEPEPEDTGRSVEELERSMEDALSRIKGAGEVRVVLTLRSGTRRVLAEDQQEERRETVIVSAGTGRQEAVTVQEIYPDYQGALVVCTGGGDAGVRWNILRSVMALTGLEANQISICEGTGGTKQ